MQQSLIHEVMQQDVAMGQALSKEERIEALECELFALRRNGKKFDSIQVPRAAYQPANVTPKATPMATPLTSDTSVTSSHSDLTPAPAAKPADKAKHLNIPNQFRTVVMPKQLVGASTNMVQDPSNIFEDILPMFAIEEPQFLLGSNANTANGLTSNKALFASVDPIEAYINLLPCGEKPVVLTVAKDSQSLCTVMMLIDNKEEVECIHDSGSQIILMSAEIASDIGLSYNPNIVLNMQSANGTMD
ncbi:hypothetical protein C0989_006077 [Termitomyces sp. Mn162]|nr:hypothetical protein C0989_006077 [Termitomyces sp. Mn162]